MFILVIVSYTIIGFIEIKPIVQSKRIKQLILYSIVFAAAFTLNILLVFNVKIPSPAVPMDALWKSVYGFFIK